ncbi:aminoglycoside phosphotransferase [Geobacillus sp. 46C-IIa]|uniref:phosphotransferase n=1 Tax=Geobacillus sp. 46C-IIa TaxID=1963025 RepID=UPI0009BE5217|nr:phosphotransferase [Geobacillus sp. 46C-IIa]OQP05568.1 aminoglycoside phosphotransferase [Geobacillus sp. 46C-IIa]QNU27177.1 phosphotransferase [Geobacillus sp. 46C-IIa]
MASKRSRLLFDVLNNYGLSQTETDVIGELKEEKVWLVQNKKTGQRYVLKRLNEEKTNFPILLHSRLYEIGFHVPKIFQTKTNQYYVHRKNSYYYLMDYVSLSETRPSFQQRIEGLARFHADSLFTEWIGTGSPSFPEPKEVLRAHRQKVAQLQELAKTAANRTALSHIMKQMTRLADQSYALLEKSNLAGFCLEAAERKAICHGDYNSNNLLLAANNNVVMIDFDRAYYGLPLDDFRFLLISLTKNPKNNVIKRLQPLFELYFSICLTYAPYKSVYLADAMFPHVFYNEAVGLEKPKRAASSPSSLNLLTRLAEQETKKFAFLSDLLKSEGSRT